MNALIHKLQQKAGNMLMVQLMAVLILTGVVFVLTSLTIASSALMGGLVCVLANSLFARKVFAQTGASASRYVMNAFYLGEVQKLVITALLFFIAIKYIKVVFLPFLLMYIGAQFAFWLSPLISDIPLRRTKKN